MELDAMPVRQFHVVTALTTQYLGQSVLVIRRGLMVSILQPLGWLALPDLGMAQSSAAPSLYPTIASGTYWTGLGLGRNAMQLEIEGDRYTYADETGKTAGQPIAGIKAVGRGVIQAEGRYWCLSTLPKPKEAHCSVQGWTTSTARNVAVQNPPSCGRTLIATQNQLLQAGDLVSLQLSAIRVGDRYSDNPTPRPIGYEFWMIGQGGYTILATPKLLESLSQTIIRHCPTVALVTFKAYPEGEAVYGFVNQRSQLFACYEAYEIGQSPNPKPPWGYQACFP